MENIFAKLGNWFKPKQEEREYKVIGFYSHTGDLFLYNSFDDRFDNYLYIDLSDTAYKYENATIKEAEVCMKIEGCIGDLEEINLFY